MCLLVLFRSCVRYLSHRSSIRLLSLAADDLKIKRKAEEQETRVDAHLILENYLNELRLMDSGVVQVSMPVWNSRHKDSATAQPRTYHFTFI